MDMKEVMGYIDGLEITGCAIRSTGEMAFVAQDWSCDDALEPKRTDIFAYKPFEKEGKQWGSAGLGTCRAMFVCPSYIPDERWLFVTSGGDVCVVSKEGPNFENRVLNKRTVIFGIKTIGDDTYCVGPGRKVMKRIEKNHWLDLSTEVLKKEHPNDIKGFRDIDGFSDTDLYACGGRDDLWRYNGTEWYFVDLPIKGSINHLCCGTNGFLYVLVDSRTLISGREGDWRKIKIDLTKDFIGGLYWYQDRLIFTTEVACFELRGDKVERSKLIDESPLKFYDYISCYEDKMFLVNGTEAAYYDGNCWEKIL